MSFPDATQLVIGYLGPLLTPAVHSRVPDPRPDTFVQVRRVGGPFEWPVLDQPRLNFTAWALTEPAAYDLITEVRAAVWALKGSNLLGVPCYQVEEFTGPTSATDPSSGQPRWQMTATLTLRAE